MLELGLKDKIALVTGGSDGLGRATAELLAREGANVVVTARRKDHLTSVAEEISANASGDVLPVAGDVKNAAECATMINQAVEKFGGLDILVNNAGAAAASSLEDLSDEEWQSDFDLKVMAAVRLSRLAVPHMRKRGGGSIINASIGGGKAPRPNQLPTSLTRAAGLNLTKSLAGAYAADNIRVNAVCIGLIKSAQWERKAADGSLDQLYADMAKSIPLGRVGEAEDYANLVAFLCSTAGSYITGAAINLDGGLCPVV